MKTTTEKVVVSWLLAQAALKMLASSSAGRLHGVQKEADRAYRQLQRACTAEELVGVDLMGNAMVGLAEKLAHCPTVGALEQSVHYVMDLRDGRVLIMEDDGSFGTAH